MTARHIVLDSGPLGLVTNRVGKSNEVTECLAWIDEITAAGSIVIVPEMADYEVRRELIRANKMAGIARLDVFELMEKGRYLALTTVDVRLAAELWAKSRRAGKPTGPDTGLDADVLIAAQALSLGDDVIVATDNTKHFSQFVTADDWRNIRP